MTDHLRKLFHPDLEELSHLLELARAGCQHAAACLVEQSGEDLRRQEALADSA